MKRRGLLAAAVAAVAALVAKISETPVSAANGDPVTVGGNAVANVATVLRNNGAYTSSGAALTGLRHTNTLNVIPSYRMGVFGFSGSSQLAIGVHGSVDTRSQGGHGVVGFGDGTGTGVWGLTYSGPGVLGQSYIGIPVFGQVPAGSTTPTVGVYGENTSQLARAAMPSTASARSGHAMVGRTAGAAGTAGIVGTTRAHQAHTRARSMAQWLLSATSQYSRARRVRRCRTRMARIASAVLHGKSRELVRGFRPRSA